MKRLIFLLILFLNFLNFEKVYADNNVSYLDLDYVLSQSLAGKSINNQISAIQKRIVRI